MPLCGYQSVGIEAIRLLDFEDFEGFEFEGDDLYNGCFVTAIRRNGGFIDVDTPDSAKYYSSMQNGVYTHVLETFIGGISSMLESNLHLATKRRYITSFRTREGRYFGFGYESGAVVTYANQTAEGVGALVTITARSRYPLFEFPEEAFYRPVETAWVIDGFTFLDLTENSYSTLIACDQAESEGYVYVYRSSRSFPDSKMRPCLLYYTADNHLGYEVYPVENGAPLQNVYKIYKTGQGYIISANNGNGNVLYKTSDFVNLTQVTMPFPYETLRNLVFLNGYYLTDTPSYGVFRTQDFLTWENVNYGADYYQGLVTINGRLYYGRYTSQGDGFLMYSDDGGISWQYCNGGASITPRNESPWVEDIKYINGVYYLSSGNAGGERGRIFRSYDGENWESVYNTDSACMGILYDSEYFWIFTAKRFVQSTDMADFSRTHATNLQTTLIGYFFDGKTYFAWNYGGRIMVSFGHQVVVEV
jgi:hypothetical protein